MNRDNVPALALLVMLVVLTWLVVGLVAELLHRVVVAL